MIQGYYYGQLNAANFMGCGTLKMRNCRPQMKGLTTTVRQRRRA